MMRFVFSVPILSKNKFETVDFKVQIVYSLNDVEEPLSQEYQFSSNNSQFSGGVGTYFYALSIPAGKIGGKIKLKYFYRCNHTAGGLFSKAQYSVVTFTTYPNVNELPPPFYKNTSTGSVYVKIDGVYRLVYDQIALNACFLSNVVNTTAIIGNTNPSPIGNQLGGTITYTEWVFPINRPPFQVTRTTSGNPLLVQDALTGKIYFVEKVGGPGLSYNARWIVNQETFNYYKFDASKISIQTINWNGPGPFVPTDGWNLGLNLSMP